MGDSVICWTEYDCTFCTGRASKSHCELLCFRKENDEQGNNSQLDIKKPSGQTSSPFNSPSNSPQGENFYSNASVNSTCAANDSQGSGLQKSEHHNVHPMYSNGSPFYAHPFHSWPHPYMQSLGAGSFDQKQNPTFCSPYFMGMPPMPYPYYGFH